MGLCSVVLALLRPSLLFVTDADRHVLPKTFTVLHENLKEMQNIQVVETVCSEARVASRTKNSTGTPMPPAGKGQPHLPMTNTQVVVQEYFWGDGCLCSSLEGSTMLGARHTNDSQPFSEVEFEFKSISQKRQRPNGVEWATTLNVNHNSSSKGSPVKLHTSSSDPDTNCIPSHRKGDNSIKEEKEISCTGQCSRCSFDLIIGSDIIYMDSSFPLLLTSLHSLSHRRTRIVLAGKFRRSTDLQFFDLAKEAGFVVSRVPSAKVRASLRHLVCEEGIFLYEMYLAGQ